MTAKLSGLPGGASSHCTLPPGLVIWIVTGWFEQTGDGERVGAESTRGVGNTLSASCREVALQPFAAVTVTLYRLPLSFSRVNVLPRVPSSIFREASTNGNSPVFSGNVSSSFDHCGMPLRGGRGRVGFLSHLYPVAAGAVKDTDTRKEASSPGQIVVGGGVSVKSGTGFTVSTAALEASSSDEARQQPSALNDFTRYR